MTVSPEQFLAHMEWLASTQKCISLAEAMNGGEGIVVTFDDGLRDQYVNAVPILKRLGIPATFFVVGAGPSSQERALVYVDDPKMNWDEIRDLDAQGFEIGSHTMTHRQLSSLSIPEQEVEIGGSKRIIEEQLGHPIQFISFPYGTYLDYTPDTLGIVRAAGYAGSLSNRYGVAHPKSERWEMKRVWLDHSDDLPYFQAKVEGCLDFLALLDTRFLTWIRRAMNGNLTLPALAYVSCKLPYEVISSFV
jgi:peptidoglycan/xylan/chitin deacetylase (PgdA/CDA1 family)